MALPALNFNEAAIDRTSKLWDLYSRLLQGAQEAAAVDLPDLMMNPPLTPGGEIDTAAIQAAIANYNLIFMKNSAYLYANSAITVIGEGGGGGGGDFVRRIGDSMAGTLTALYGFSAGIANSPIFSVNVDTDDVAWARVYDSLQVDNNAFVDGYISLGDDGIYFNDAQTIFWDNNKLKLSTANIVLDGQVEFTNDIIRGNITITQDAIYNENDVYYHAGNSNLNTVDWTMLDATVAGNLSVAGTGTFGGALSALYGFSFGYGNSQLFYSALDEQQVAYTILNSDLLLTSGHGIKVGGVYVINAINTNRVGFMAPGKVIDLGGAWNNVGTTRMVLKTGIYDETDTYQMISKNGDGNFKNSLQAGAGNAGPIVLKTYYTDSTDSGVIFAKNIRLGSATGPFFKTNSIEKQIIANIPYTYVDSELESHTVQIPFWITYAETTSLFRDQSKEWSASLNLHTDAEFFTFKKPVEGTSFSIISETYKTRLIENALFFNDGIFIEGVNGGMLMNGNVTVTGSMSSPSFSSGFAGNGWAILKNLTTGSVAATFDELTIRKKMRVFELEVQKISATNGSLWVSDSCSGDMVEEIVS